MHIIRASRPAVHAGRRQPADPELNVELAELRATAAAAAARLRAGPRPPLTPEVAEHLVRSAENERDPLLKGWYLDALRAGGER